MVRFSKSFIAVAALIFFTCIIFLPRLETLPFRGEEPRRVVSAYEMVQSQNWFVPTIQHQLFLSRPPFQNWVIAVTGNVLGSFNHLSGRLPSVICALLTAFLIYFYSTAFLCRKTAFLAALFFLTMPQVMQLGRTAETELMFTFFLSGSFLLWHRGEVKKWSSYWKWGIAYSFLALATLTKGINQAPIYFAAIIGFHLLINRRLKSLISLPHVAGVLIFCLVVGVWQGGFIHYVGAKTGWLMHAGDVGLRFENFGFKQYLEHGLTFPFELTAVMLPWSLALFAYASRRFWIQTLTTNEKKIALFCLGAILITILSVWYPPGARTRYYMPLFPCFAILAAIAIQALEEKTHKVGLLCARALMLLLPLAGVVIFLQASLHIRVVVPPESVTHATLYLLGTIFLALAIGWMKTYKKSQLLYGCIGAYALFAALSMALVYTDSRLESYNAVEPDVVNLIKQIPESRRLTSLGPVAFDFLYYYVLHTGHSIPIASYDSLLGNKSPSPQYFCMKSQKGLTPATLPLQWELIREIETGRYKKTYTRDATQTMIIGKVLKVHEFE